MTVEGTYKFTGGDGMYVGMSGGGKFKTTMKSETEIERSWDGTYEAGQGADALSNEKKRGAIRDQ